MVRTLFVVFAAASATLAHAALLDRPTLVDVAWLQKHAGESSLRIIDARDLKPYLESHIPGAVYLNVETLRMSEGGVPASLLPKERIGAIFATLGVGRDTDAVIYSSASDDLASSTYVATMLEAIGHRHVGVLDGGFEAWKAANGTVDAEIPSISRRLLGSPTRLENIVDANFVQRSAEGLNLFDARPPEVYVKGHVPNAKSLPLKKMLTEGPVPKWKTADELTKELREAGFDATKPTITYCTTGREGSLLYFTIRHVLGIPNVGLYDGSFLDWRSKKLPVEATSQ